MSPVLQFVPYYVMEYIIVTMIDDRHSPIQIENMSN